MTAQRFGSMGTPARPRHGGAGRSAARTSFHSVSAWVALAALGLAPLAAASPAADSIRFSVRVTNLNRVGLTTTNYGFFGNNFVSRSPSFEYPLGSGYEHMSRAGLWIGAMAISDTGAFLGVTTAIVDNAQGSSAIAETEFTPAGNHIEERSRIRNSPFFSLAALSDQDLVSAYSDQPGRGASGPQAERHTPLRVLVHQRVLAYSLPVADAFVVVQYTITNQGPPLRNVWVGQYAQLVSGDKNAYSAWPPSSSSGPGSWYYRTYVEFDQPRRLYREHFCNLLPYPEGCDLQVAPPWAGVMLLRTLPDPVDGMTLGLNWWSYAPGDASRDTDRERYAILSNGLIMDPTGCIPGGSCSPIMVMSVGPFAEIDPGDSISVDFAFVAGDHFDDLTTNAEFAQFASDQEYRLPQAPPSPRVHVVAGARRAEIYWDDSPEFAPDETSPAPGGLDFQGYRVYLGSDRQAPTRVAQFDIPDTTGFNTGLDSIRVDPPLEVDGVTYRYRRTVTGLRDGFIYYGAVTSYDTGDPRVPSLESGLTQNKFQVVPLPRPGESPGGVTVFPNPYRVEASWDRGTLVRDHYLWFANLPARAVLRIYTLAGDLVFETRFHGSTYRGEGTRGLYDPRQDLDTPPPALSGASYAWNLITSNGQALATALYVFSVEDLDTGGYQRGKFLVVKSDREN